MGHGFKAEGEISLYGATVGGTLDCSKGEFLNANGDVILAQNMKAGGDVYLRDGFKANGSVDLSRATISGILAWSDTIEPKYATMDLRNAHVGVLADASNSWPSDGNLHGTINAPVHCRTS